MKVWLVPVIGVSVCALVVLIVLSFDTLEFQEIGLNYSWISESVEETPYTSGRYYLGIGNRFLKYPKMVNTVYFIDDATEKHGPSLQSRTSDGLNVRLEVSFQYRLKFEGLYNLFKTLGPTYEQTMVRIAIEQVTTAATFYDAHTFFSNRTLISTEMHDMLNQHFGETAFSEVPFFQLRTVHLPNEFEEAIKDTQVKQQEIQIAALEQKTNRVSFETLVLQAEQAVNVMQNQASAEAASIIAQNDAYCKQYIMTQTLQSNALKQVVDVAGWDNKQLLEYMRIRAVREHPSDKTTVKI